MVGSRGKGSRSKLKGLASGPVKPEPVKIIFDESSDGLLDGEVGKTDTLNSEMNSLEEEQMDEIIFGSVSGDGLEGKDPNSQEVNDREKDGVTEMDVNRSEDFCSHEGTIKDVNEVSGGSDATADVSAEDNEEKTNKMKAEEEHEARKNDKEEEDEAPVMFKLGHDDACAGDERKSPVVSLEGVPTDKEGLAFSDHVIMENMTDDLEYLIEPSKLDLEEPIGHLSDRGHEENVKENANSTNEVKENTGQVIRPKRKAGKKKVVKKKIMVRKPKEVEAGKNDKKPEEVEAPMKFELDNNDTGTADESKSSEVNMADNLENHKEPSKLDTEEPIRTLSDRGEEEQIKENASIINEVKEVTGQVNRPKRKIMKKKVVKKKMVQRHARAANEELLQLSDENNAFGEACKADTNGQVNNEDLSDGPCKVGTKDHVNNEDLSDEVCKVDTNEHVNNENPSVEACKTDKNEHANNEEAEVKPSVKFNRKLKIIRKKKTPGTATAQDAHRPQSGNEETRIVKHVGVNEPDGKNGEVGKSGDKGLLKRSQKKKFTKKVSQEGVPEDVNRSKPSKEGKSSKRIDSMGMIFMCSSETKKDCYQYKILGLPAGKKDMVSKIYQGMRLFLFDIDLRMLYGIYKAAAPGGYNIEPRAFKSQYPSQVRFAVLEDCVPLAEERFKNVLKDNYYTKNKFDCQLNSKQVKNLCKLFHEANKKAESQKASGSRRPADTGLSARRDKKRKRAEDIRRGAATPVERERSRRRAHVELRRAPVVIDDRSRRRAREEITRHAPMVIDDRSWRRTREQIRHAPVVIDDRSRRRAQEEIRHAPVVIDDRSRIRAQEELRHTPLMIDDRSRRRAQEELRHAPLMIDDTSRRRVQEEIRHTPVVIDDRYHGLPVYERETYISSVAPASSYQPLQVHSPSRARMYSFDRTLEVDPYRRDSILDHRDLSLLSSRESRLPIGLSHLNAYAPYREPHVYSGSVYSTDTRREHYDYTSGEPYAQNYTPAEHRPPPPLYRRY
ncbi:uncharacterized protein [Spinacia oleracea]|nr:uncharacterized protein LOC110802541 isoform X2 [Spinacia oleracea]